MSKFTAPQFNDELNTMIHDAHGMIRNSSGCTGETWISFLRAFKSALIRYYQEQALTTTSSQEAIKTYCQFVQHLLYLAYFSFSKDPKPKASQASREAKHRYTVMSQIYHASAILQQNLFAGTEATQPILWIGDKNETLLDCLESLYTINLPLALTILTNLDEARQGILQSDSTNPEHVTLQRFFTLFQFKANVLSELKHRVNIHYSIYEKQLMEAWNMFLAKTIMEEQQCILSNSPMGPAVNLTEMEISLLIGWLTTLSNGIKTLVLGQEEQDPYRDSSAPRNYDDNPLCYLANGQPCFKATYKALLKQSYPSGFILSPRSGESIIATAAESMSLKILISFCDNLDRVIQSIKTTKRVYVQDFFATEILKTHTLRQLSSLNQSDSALLEKPSFQRSPLPAPAASAGPPFDSLFDLTKTVARPASLAKTLLLSPVRKEKSPYPLPSSSPLRLASPPEKKLTFFQHQLAQSEKYLQQRDTQDTGMAQRLWKQGEQM